MKILVLGAHGMAGHMITKYLKTQNLTVTTVARNKKYGHADYYFDLENHVTNQTLTKIIKNYDFIINAQGILVQPAQNNPSLAMLVNAWWPWNIAETIKNTNQKLIHISTDCVFSGKTGPYKETDIPDETNPYGRSKAAGEVNNHLVIRTSIIGPELKPTGTGLFNWITKNNQVMGYKNHMWNGITTLELAKIIHKHIENPTISEIYHPAQNIYHYSKLQILEEIADVYKLNIQITPHNNPKSQNKILLNMKNNYFHTVPTIKQQLLEMKEFYK